MRQTLRRTVKRIRFVFPISLLAAFAFCVPALRCYATTEPELTTAIRARDFQHVQTLLSEGVNVNERDEGAEQTPLMWAVQIGNAATVQSLIHHGAALNARDDNGDTALSLARRNGHPRIAQILIESGARLTDQKETLHRRTARSSQRSPEHGRKSPAESYALTRQ